MQFACMPSLRRLLALAPLSLLLAAGPADAETRVLCAYDPAGRAGDYFRIVSEYALAASSWGVEVEVRPYTDEETATKDYEAGVCDGVVALGVRLQRFNRFPSTVEAMGGITKYAILEQLVDSMATYETAAARLRSGEHETVGFLSAGAVYLYVRDRRIDTVEELAGKRIATMDYDSATPVMVDRVGSIQVPVDLSSLGPKFNNGDADACYASAPAYDLFELWRGLGTEGGILDAPLGMATLQVMIRAPRFPEGFGAKSRKDLALRFDESLVVAKRADDAIPDRYWIPIPPERRAQFDEMFRDVRIHLRDEAGAYDGKMLSALRKLRCADDPTRAECAEQKE